MFTKTRLACSFCGKSAAEEARSSPGLWRRVKAWFRPWVPLAAR